MGSERGTAWYYWSRRNTHRVEKSIGEFHRGMDLQYIKEINILPTRESPEEFDAELVTL